MTYDKSLSNADLPSISNLSRVRDKLTSRFEHEVSLACPLTSGSNVNFKWYKNGVDVSSSSNLTGYLNYRDEGSTFGIYQCFARNSVGSDYAIVRLLNGGMY